MRKRWFPDANWWLVVPLGVLYIIGIAGFWAPNYVPAIADLAKNGVSPDWLGFFGSLIGATVTLLAAIIAWFAVKHQIDAQAAITDEIRARKEFAARGRLPLSLSSLYQYAEDCIRALDDLPDPIAPGTILKLPKLPLQEIQEIKLAIEFIERSAAIDLLQVVQFLQIQNARLRPLERSAFDGSLTVYEIQRRTIDTLDLFPLLDRAFVYARGADFETPCATSDQLEEAIRLHGVADAQPWIQAELERRRKIEAGAKRLTQA